MIVPNAIDPGVSTYRTVLPLTWVYSPSGVEESGANPECIRMKNVQIYVK